MDDIKTRLQEASQNCLKAYESWDTNKKNSGAQEGMHAAIHELRKVCSRLEIELAISERDQMTSRPLPIPAHRASRNKGPHPDVADGAEDEDDAFGNTDGAQSGHAQKSGHSGQQQRRHSVRKRTGSGGSSQGGGNQGRNMSSAPE